MSDDRTVILNHCDALARSAERWGAGPQGARLCEIADHALDYDFKGMLSIRDELKKVRDEARFSRLGLIVIALMMAGSIGLIIHGAR